jgi:osmotically-inducible protein OsmY
METILKKSDVSLQEDVLHELRWDTRVGATEIGVLVDKGVVTLTGTVDGYAKKFAALEAAHRVAGVRDVADEIRVHYPGSGKQTDAELAHAVRHALEWDVFVPDRQITSTVEDGWVTLGGKVDFLREKEDAALAVRQIVGVKGIWNEIRVAGPRVEPAAIRRKIEEALERRAEREAERITVGVDDATVTLSGTVRSWPEKQAIMGAVGHAPGVHAVKDQLQIGPDF